MSSRRRRRKKTSPLLVILIVIAIIVIGGGVGFTSYMNSTAQAVDPNSTQAVIVTIPQGSGTGAIAELLLEKGLIRDVNSFKLHSRTKGYDGKFKAGEYSLTASMSVTELMDTLVAGNVNTMRFTIPEGYDIARTTEKLASEGFINTEVFQQEIQWGEFQYDWISMLPPGENRLEGFLYPETYDVFTTASEHDIVDRMLKQFDSVFLPEYYDRLDELGLSLYELITLASIIEREAVVSEDRPIISGVFYNRLAIDMPLQSCATVQYVLGEVKPVLSIADTQTPSPYNTYLNAGLPPGPICSPGIESIRAALYPTESDYLFFVAKGDGSHAFSVTYGEHLQYKDTYQ